MKDGPLPRRWLIASLCLAACAPSYGSTYDKAYATAERSESAGRLAEAVQAYDHAAAVAKRRGDADQARWAAADALAREDRVGDAVVRLDAMAADPASDRQAEAAYRAADLRIGHGDPDRGWHDMESVVRRFPTHGVAHAAIRRLVAHADESAGGTKAGLDELAALQQAVGRTELAELIADLSAEHLQTLGDDQAARDAFVRIPTAGPTPTAPSSTAPSGRPACSTRSSGTTRPPPTTWSACSPSARRRRSSAATSASTTCRR